MALILIILGFIALSSEVWYSAHMRRVTRSPSVAILWRAVALAPIAWLAGMLTFEVVISPSVDQRHNLVELGEGLQILLAAAAGFGLVYLTRVASRRIHSLERAIGSAVDRVLVSLNIDAILTIREGEVLLAFGTGLPIDDKSLADRLFISPHTAHSHVQALLRKTGLADRRDLVFLAVLRSDGFLHTGAQVSGSAREVPIHPPS